MQTISIHNDDSSESFETEIVHQDVCYYRDIVQYPLEL